MKLSRVLERPGPVPAQWDGRTRGGNARDGAQVKRTGPAWGPVGASCAACNQRPLLLHRWLRVTVLPGCVGCRTVEVEATRTVRDLKDRIAEDTGFPAAEQRLWLGHREVGAALSSPA